MGGILDQILRGANESPLIYVLLGRECRFEFGGKSWAPEVEKGPGGADVSPLHHRVCGRRVARPCRTCPMVRCAVGSLSVVERIGDHFGFLPRRSPTGRKAVASRLISV